VTENDRTPEAWGANCLGIEVQLTGGQADEYPTTFTYGILEADGSLRLNFSESESPKRCGDSYYYALNESGYLNIFFVRLNVAETRFREDGTYLTWKKLEHIQSASYAPGQWISVRAIFDPPNETTSD